MIKKCFVYRRLLWDMVLRQFRSRYAGSALGIWWSVITPLVLALSINFVFSAAFKLNTPNYTFFALAGIIPWLFFVNALTEAANSFTLSSSILKQNIFPREFVPLSFILANFINFLIGLILLLPLFLILKLKIIVFLPFLVLTIIFHLFFTAGIGILFAVINAFYHDLSHFLSIAFMIWFWATPVFYSLDMLAFPYRWICLLNPMSYYIVLYHNFLVEAKWPSLQIILTAFVLSLVSFLSGCFIYNKNEPALLKRI